MCEKHSPFSHRMNPFGRLLEFLSCLLGCSAVLIPSETDSSLQQTLAGCILNISKTYFDTDLPIAVQTPEMWYPRHRFANTDGERPLQLLSSQSHIPQLTLGDVGEESYTWRNAMKPGSHIFIIPHVSPREMNEVASSMIRRTLRDSRNPNARVAFLFMRPFANAAQRNDMMHHLLTTCLFSRLLKVKLIVPRQSASSHSLDVYTFVPNEQRDICSMRINVVWKIDVWIGHESKFLYGEDLFPSQTELNLRKCQLRLYTSHLVPFSSWFSGRFLGPGIETLALFCEIVNCTLSVSTKFKYESHILFIRLYTEYIIYDNWMTYPYFRLDVFWFVPSGRFLPRWRSMFKVFSPLLALFTCVTAVLGTFTLWLLQKPVDGSKSSGHSVILTALLAHLYACDNIKFRDTSGSAFFSLWLFYCLLINTAYQTGLFGLLVYPGHEPVIQTLEQLKKSGLHMKRNIVLSGTSELAAEIMQYEYCHDGDKSCYTEVADSGTAAVLEDNRVGKFTTDLIKDRWGNNRMVPIEESFATFLMSFEVVNLRSLLHSHLERLLGRLANAGLLDKWSTDLMWVVKMQTAPDKPPAESVFAFSVIHLQGPLWLLLIGWSLSISTFFAERFIYRRVREFLKERALKW
ncbi:Ionotropic receptor 399 [Blattella germanica]|nr:Ionotropic receptor 399 [Blattella germanica]